MFHGGTEGRQIIHATATRLYELSVQRENLYKLKCCLPLCSDQTLSLSTLRLWRERPTPEAVLGGMPWSLAGNTGTKVGVWLEMEARKPKMEPSQSSGGK